MEGSVARSLGRLERILKVHECVSCVQSGLVCRDLAIVLWNTVAFEIVSVVVLENLKRDMLEGLCEVVSRKGALEATDMVYSDTCNLIKAIARKSIQNYFSDCSRLLQDSEVGTSAQQSYFVLMDKATEKLELFFSSKFSEGLEYFVEPMICPFARICLERQSCTLEIRAGVRVFQYIVRHMGKFAFKYNTLLSGFIVRFLEREDYKDEMFRLLYPDVVDLVGVIAEFGKDAFKEHLFIRKYWTDNFFLLCHGMLNITEATYHDPHLDSKVYGQLKLIKFANKEISFNRVGTDKPRARWMIRHLMDPLRFENYEKMRVIYDTYLELLEIDYNNGHHATRFYNEDHLIWIAFCGYFQQRTQKGDDNKELQSRLITALGGNDCVDEVKIRCQSYKTRFWMPSSVLRNISTIDASTQVHDNDFLI